MNMHDDRFRKLFRVLVWLTLFTSTHPASASAEPISALYSVQVTERNFQPFDQQFTLRVTIDPAVATPFSQFGELTFSPIPLETIPAPDEVLPLTTFGTAGAFVFPDSVLYSAGGGTGGSGGGLHYLSSVRLSASIPAADAPVALDAQTFLMLLGGGFGGTASFSYWNVVCEGLSGLENCLEIFPALPRTSSVRFIGTATLVQVEPPAEPIPEPTTIALVGGGLVALLRRRLS